MTGHTYKPGDLIEVQGDDGEWHARALDSNEQFVYVGEWAGEILVGFSGYYAPYGTKPEYVRPYTPPIEIPEGWTLMRSDELEVGVHEVYDPHEPDDPWPAEYLIDPEETAPHLLVARRRADDA